MTATPMTATLVTDEAIAALAPEDRALWDAMGAAVPTYTTMPTPGAKHELREVDSVTNTIGTPLLPWQRWAVRVITEKSMTDPGRYRYPEVTLTVERQSGKTTLVRGILLARTLLHNNRMSAYTAQTGKDAGERWGELCERVIHAPMLAPKFKVRRATGSQRLMCLATGSRIFPFPPTETAMHGYTPHDVALDEIFALDEARGTALMGAIKPAQQTIKDRQMLMFSTAGHAESTFLRGRVDSGRVYTGSPTAPVAYLEWSFPEGLDVYDEDTWQHHPALGHLIEVEDLRELAATTPPGEWRRAFCNQWVESLSPLYDLDGWAKLASPIAAPALSECALGFAVDADRTRAAVVAAWRVGDRQVVKLVHSSHDVDRLPETVEGFVLREDRPKWVGADHGGLTRGTLDAVRRRLPEFLAEQVHALSPDDWMIASTSLVDKISMGTLTHEDDPILNQALAGAKSRSFGGAWALSHSSPPELLAMAAALRGLDTVRMPTPEPMIYFGEDFD